jgi:hypothetical protein
MAVRDSYVGDQAAGSVLTAANFERLAGGWLGYAEVTASQIGIVAEADVAGLTVAPEVNDGRRIKVSAHVNLKYNSTTAESFRLLMHLKEGSTYLGGARFAGFSNGISDDPEVSASPFVILTPTAGVHTYKVALARNLGTGTVETVSSATFPLSILVEDLGPAT